MRPTRIAAAILTAVVLGTAATDAAVGPTLSVSPTTAHRGDRIAISGKHWGNHKVVTLRVGRPKSDATALIGPVHTTNDGRFKGSVPVKKSAAPGTYIIIACRKACAIKRTRAVNILP